MHKEADFFETPDEKRVRLAKDVFPGGRNRFECGGHFEKVLSVCLLEQRGLLVSAGVDRVVRRLESCVGSFVAEEWQFTFEDYSCRLSLVRPNLIAADFPSRPRQHWLGPESCEERKRERQLASRLNRDHPSYLVINLSGCIYDTFELQGPVMDIMMSGCVLPLEVLLRLVVSVHHWLARAAGNVVVVHGADEPCGTSANYGPGSFPVVLFFACYLSWVGKADHPKEAMLEVSRQGIAGKRFLDNWMRQIEAERRCLANEKDASSTINI
eukprot:Skav219761  [mRNA]  locus=scaffold569:290381:297942:- [translate_table: standard]